MRVLVSWKTEHWVFACAFLTPATPVLAIVALLFATEMPWGSRPSMAALTRLGARNASEVFMLTPRAASLALGNAFRSGFWNGRQFVEPAPATSDRRKPEQWPRDWRRVSETEAQSGCGIDVVALEKAVGQSAIHLREHCADINVPLCRKAPSIATEIASKVPAH